MFKLLIAALLGCAFLALALILPPEPPAPLIAAQPTLAAVVFGLAMLAVLAIVVQPPRLRRRLLFAGCGLAAVAALGGCTPFTALAAGGDGVGKQVLSNLESCDRHYEGALGAGMTGSFKIDCRAQVTTGAAIAAAPPGDASAIPK